jgi:hypothetical protein
MLQLASLDPETGERPASRIGNAGNARSLITRLKHEDDTRMWRYSRQMGLLDGNPPWPAERLRSVGQAHRANFNLREGEGIVDAAKTPYYDLVFEVPEFAQITFGFAGADPTVNKEWSDTISEEYYEVLCAWDGFDQNIQLHQWQMVVNGVGPIFWPHSVSWYSEAVKSRKVLVPQETMASVDKLEMCVILHSYRADELERYIANSSAASKQGWDVPLVEDTIIKAATQETRNTYGNENYDLYQRAIRTGDLYYGLNRSNRIYVASLFIKEFGQKVSHYILTDTAVSPNEKVSEDLTEETGYLFKKHGKYDSFSQVLCPFFYDTGPDGTWHSVKGLGPKIFDFCDVSNRTFCQMLDGAVIGSGITLEAQDGASLEETQVALIGGATIVQPGYKVVQTRIAEAINGAMAMRRELQNTLQSNTGSYRQRVAEEARQEPTLGQAQLNYQTQAQLSKGATNRYYNNLDKFHRETLRRLMDPAQNDSIPGGTEAKKFVMRCITRGIPPEVFNFRNILKVRSVRSLGYGSPQLRDMATKELVSMIPLMDEQSRNHALRARAAALPGIGQSQVDSFFPKLEKMGVPNAQTSYAVTENNALRTLGGKALVEPSQNHSIHFDVHYADATQHAQDPNEKDPTAILIHLEQAGPHLQQHLNLLEGDPTRKAEFKKKTDQLQQLAKITDELRNNVQEKAQAIADRPPDQGNGQGGAPQMNPDTMVKLTKAQGELALKTQKAQADSTLKIRQHQVNERLADLRTAAEIKRQNLRTAEDIRAARLQEQATGGKAGGGKIPP